MAIFRCNQCGHLREVASDHIGKSAKCPQCQQVAAIHDTIVFIEKILEKYFLQQKELITLRQETNSIDQLEIQVIDKPGEELFSLQDIDIHNTTELANNRQYQPIIDWFGAKKVTVNVNPKELDTTGFFDEVAIELGNNYEILREVCDKIKRIQKKGYTNVNFQLAQKSQKHIQEITKFCNQLYNFSFLAKCFYQKQEKILKVTLQTAPTIVQFFNGIWLEWFVFVKMFNVLKEKQIPFSGARSLTVTLPNEDYHELDAFFLINDSIPLCIECKSGEFRQDLDKYSRLRKRLHIEQTHFLLCVAGLSDEQAQGLTSMYEVTLVNEKSLFSHVEQLLGSL
jgi:phage FluMu protein Com